MGPDGDFRTTASGIQDASLSHSLGRGGSNMAYREISGERSASWRGHFR